MKSRLSKTFCLALALLMFCLSATAFAATQKQSKKEYTVDDFTPLLGYKAKQDSKFLKPFKIPEHRDIADTFGYPEQTQEERDGTDVYTYAFGRVLLWYGEGSIESVSIEIFNDQLAGPRKIRVGDSYEKVLKSFKNKYAGKKLPASKDGDNETQLYHMGDDEAFRAGYAHFVSNALHSISYTQTNLDTFSTVTFYIKKGIVDLIVLELGPKADS